MNIRSYPASLLPQENGAMAIRFPNFDEEIIGESLSDVCRKAEDFLAEKMLECEVEDRKMPKIDWEAFRVDTNNQIAVMIEVNLTEYQRKWNSKAIKKTLTIPEWLNELALEHNLNFSKILQEALKDKLKV